MVADVSLDGKDAAVAPTRPSPLGGRVGWQRMLGAKELGAFAAVLIICVVFTALSPNFLTAATFSNVGVVTAQYGIIAVGVTFLMIAGEFDLTTGAMFAVVPMIMAYLYVRLDWPLSLSFVVAIVAAAMMGLLNATLMIYLSLPSFIVTLGMMFWWRGLLQGVSGGLPISVQTEPSRLLHYMGGPIGGGNSVYWPVVWYAVLLAGGIYALEFTRWGNRVYAVGSSPQAAKAMGVSVNRVKMTCFMLSAALAGLSGCLIFGYQSSVQPSAGVDFELYAIVATVVGGTSLFGGSGSVAGSLFGAAIIAIAGVGLVLIGAPAAWYQAFVGLVLIIALAVNTRITGSRLRSMFTGGAK